MTSTELPWIVRTADSARMGLTRATLEGPCFERVRRGVWSAATGGVLPDARIAAVAADLPEHAVVAGWAAARMHELASARDGMEVFDGSRFWEELQTSTGRRTLVAVGGVEGSRVVVASASSSRLRFRPDVRVLRTTVTESERCVVGGVAVTTPVRTAMDLARLLATRPAVVGVDRLLQLGAVAFDELSRAVGDHRRWIGVGHAREVLDLVDGRVESPQESILRLIWREAGLPRPLCNVVVRRPSGSFVGRVDMIDPAVGLVAEYDGFWHSGSDRRGADARRQQALEALGLVVVRATGDDVRPEREYGLAQRLREAHRRAAATSRGDWVLTEG